MKTKFDKIDIKILEMLIDDGRQSLTQISKAIDISNTGTKKRVSKLNDSGFLKVQGNCNIEAMNFKACIIFLEVKNYKYTADIIKVYKHCPNVFLITEIIGNFNLMIGFFGNSSDDLNNKLKFCSPINREGILHSKISMITSFVFPKFLPLKVHLNDNEELNNCGCICAECEGFKNHGCKGCY